MRAFEENLLENTFLCEEAEALEAAGFINASQGELIEKQTPAYRGHSNLLARIGIFVLACLLYSSTCGLITFLVSTRDGNYTGMFFIYTLVGFAGLELLIRRMKYYANGADDAFLFGAQVSFLCFTGSWLIDNAHETWWPLFLSAALLGSICCIRYVDRFAALLACLGLTALVINLLIEAGDAGKSLLPFILMLLAAGIYLFSSWLKNKMNGKGFYNKSLGLCYGYSLFLFYLSTNYFVVREANVALMHRNIGPGEDISLAFLFYAFTFLTPPAFIFYAIRKKDRLLLWTGTICLACSVATIRYYYAVIPLEIALLIGGGLLFVIAWLSMRKLKGRTEGITFEKDKFSGSNELLNAEALILIQNFSVKATSTSENNNVDFGGGEFGGAGSGDKY